MYHFTPLNHRFKVTSSWVTIFKGLGLFLIAIMLCLPVSAQAQSGSTAIARTYTISGEAARSGDLVSFDREAQGFSLTKRLNDKSFFGVVVSDPVILLRTIAGGAPIVSAGEVYVNVTTINGSIAAGDYITSSAVPGNGQKASATTTFVVGTALESFPKGATSSSPTVSSGLYSGSVRVLLAIGSQQQLVATTTASGGGTTVVEEGAIAVSTPISRLIKYVLASVIVFGTIYLAFKNFTANLKDSVISIGRNPLAKASIQSMTVLNTTLIIVVSAVGLFVGLMILFLPL